MQTVTSLPSLPPSAPLWPQLFYLLYFASISCIFPFLPLYFRRRGLNETQIGLLAALRPWLSLPAGAIWSGAADTSRRHQALLLAAFCGALVCRLALAGAHSYATLAALTLATEVFAAPITIIADASVLAACAAEGEYGRQRLWGAVGWVRWEWRHCGQAAPGSHRGGMGCKWLHLGSQHEPAGRCLQGIFAFVTGETITHLGSIAAAFALHGLLGLAALVPTALLPLGPLHAKLDAQAHQGSDDGDGSDAAAVAVAGQQQQQHKQRQQAKRAARSDSVGEEGTLAIVASQASVPEALQVESGAGEAALEDVPLLPKGQRPALASAAAAGDSSHDSQVAEAGGSGVRFWSGMRALLARHEARVFFCQALLIGVGVGHIEGFLFLYIDDLGESRP